MSQFSTLGIFLLLAYIVPGLTIFAALAALVPEFSALISGRTTYEYLGISLLICFFNGHLGFYIEKNIVHRVWEIYFPELKNNHSIAFLQKRSEVFVRADALGMSHAYLDQVFGEFVMFTNCSIAIIMMAIYRFVSFFVENLKTIRITSLDFYISLLSLGLERKIYTEILIFVFVVAISSIVLFWTSPIYKISCIRLAQILQEAVEKKEIATFGIQNKDSVSEKQKSDNKSSEDEKNEPVGPPAHA